jgi:3-methylfumaryl-CoA hydratase
MDDFTAWIGRTETTEDRLSDSALAGLAALLDMDRALSSSAEVAPLFHWFHFLPRVRESDLDDDGHPKRGGFMPPITLPRRMWAGSRIEFLAPVRAGADLQRLSTITSIRAKEGKTGALAFVTVTHDVAADGVTVVREEQDIVYRGADGPAPAATAARPPAQPAIEQPQADAARTIIADPVLLFRFSALTFNSHRIHYDREYARSAEGYPGLVVHGPLLATLLMDHALRHGAGKRPARFAFSARRPLFDASPFDLCLKDDGQRLDLWTRDQEGASTMTATLDWIQP